MGGQNRTGRITREGSRPGDGGRRQDSAGALEGREETRPGGAGWRQPEGDGGAKEEVRGGVAGLDLPAQAVPVPEVHHRGVRHGTQLRQHYTHPSHQVPFKEHKLHHIESGLRVTRSFESSPPGSRGSARGRGRVR